MMRVAIIAAMAGELKPLVHGWAHEQCGNVELWRWKFDEGEWVAACGGAGVDAATRAFAEVEKSGPSDLVISIGWAGSLSPALETGRVYQVSGVIDARTGERFEAEMIFHPGDERQSQVPIDKIRTGFRLSFAPLRVSQDDKRLASFRMEEGVKPAGLWLVTNPIVAGETEKQRLAAAYGAELVDMEAAGVARLALMRGIPFYCFKGVSDGYADKLPDFNRFIRADGRFDLTGMVLFSIVRPWYWPSLMRMGENSRKASQGIRESLLTFLDERAYIRQRNGYPNFKH
jgi:adenosylhomocysteine nucleosidase